jgi:hypothetical protein
LRGNGGGLELNVKYLVEDLLNTFCRKSTAIRFSRDFLDFIACKEMDAQTYY